MANTPRGEAFEKYEPSISQGEIDEAHDSGKIVVSFKSMPRLGVGDDIAYIALKLALYDGSETTILLDRFSALTINHAIQTIDRLGWSASSLNPSDVEN